MKWLLLIMIGRKRLGTASPQLARLALLGSALLVGCTPKSATDVADKFVDLYFVEIDQKKALPLTSGLAHQKIEEELSLVADIRRTYEPDAAKPSIYYSRMSQSESGDHGRFTYDLTIRQGRDETHRNALISSERVDGKWTIANFIVQEGHLPQRPQGSATAPSPN
jgi:hypothetical protein